MVIISPILAGLAVGIGVPILLFYVYGVVPVSLCRSGGCGGGSATDDSAEIVSTRAVDSTSIDAVSVNTKIPNPSIGEASLSLASDSHILREPDRESASTVALAGSMAGHRLEVQADLNSIQRYSITSLSAESGNASFGDDGAASVKALAGSIMNYKSNGSDSCSYNTNEDGTSERVRFDDNISYIASQAEKVSIGSSCSFRSKSRNVLSRVDRIYDTLSTDSIYIDITPTDEKPPRKYASQTAILRSQFFHTSVNEQKPVAKSMDDRTIIEVSNETLDGPSYSGSSHSLNSTLAHETTEL
ncbi:hypothetical protein HHI36_013457 [Cryptolaemus montrouzieri]|uniref:E3 ubiquitin-protein ligase RNF19A n=1 Tax=Cryptolaemus montrouzieri TaxID=559131 RepID=A0ABD2NIB0_9CUCU